MIYEISKEEGISDFYYCNKTQSYEHKLCIHSHLEIIFSLKNKTEVLLSENKYTVNEGEMIFIMPYEIHGYSIKNGEAFIIACPPEYFPEYREIFDRKEVENPVIGFTNVHRAMISDIEKDNFTDDLKKKALIYYSLAEIIKNCSLKDKDLFRYDVYRKAVTYISEHYTEDISMENVAKFVGVTSSHLSRVLNSDGKPGFSELVNSLRIYAAKRMLERENVSVSEAAFKVGYGSIRNFNRVFKEYFGYNPSDLKRNE